MGLNHVHCHFSIVASASISSIFSITSGIVMEESQFKEKAKFLYDMLNLEGKKLLIHMYLSQCVQSGVPKEKCASMIEYLTGYNPLVENVVSKNERG